MSDARPPGGFFFEDFTPGQRLHHATPRTLTEGDAALYIALTGARHPAHCALPVARALGHPACPLDDLLVFNVAFGKTVPDVSYNAVANLGYADMRFLAPVYAGDTLACESEVIGTRANSNGRTGVVYVRSRASNQHGAEVLSWARWVMVARREAAKPSGAQASVGAPELPKAVEAARLSVPAWLKPAAIAPAVTGSPRLWDDYAPGETIDHPAGMTLEESEHMTATRLYQNTARVHFDAVAAASSPFGRRLAYGGHVISVCRALSYDGLENAFAIAAVHGGSHTNPVFGGDTLYCRHVVLERTPLPGREDVGALRLRMIGLKNQTPATLGAHAAGDKHPAVVLELDYSVLVPRAT